MLSVGAAGELNKRSMAEELASAPKDAETSGPLRHSKSRQGQPYQPKIRLLGPDQVSLVLGISYATARRMLVERVLPSIILRTGKRKSVVRVPEAELEKWIARKLSENGNGAKRRRRQGSSGSAPTMQNVGKNES